MNIRFKPIAKAKQEINTVIKRIEFCNLRGKKPVWKQNKKQGKFIKGNNKRVNQYYYITYILKPKLILFTLVYKKII